MTEPTRSWRKKTLKQVADWSSGGTPAAKNAAYYGGDIPWAVIGDLSDGLLTTTAKSITQAGLKNSSAKLVPQGTVLVGMYGSIGKLGISGAPLTTNQAIAAARPYPEIIDTKFLFYYLMEQRHELGRAGRGAAQQNIGQGILKAWPISLPELAVQHRIVEVLEDHLSRLDAGTAMVNRSQNRIAALDEASIVAALGLGTDTHRVVGNDLPGLEPGWHWSTLADVADVVGGVTKDAKNQSDPAFIEVPYLRVANVQRAHLDLADVASIRAPQAKVDSLALKPGDVLMNEGGDRDKLARGWIWEGQLDLCIHQNHVFRARPLGTVRPEWLAWCANSYGARWAQRHGKQSVNLASISLRTIRSMPIPVPPLDVQDARLDALRATIEGTARLRAGTVASRSRADSLRRSLLSAAFSGRLTGDSTGGHITGRAEASRRIRRV